MALKPTEIALTAAEIEVVAAIERIVDTELHKTYVAGKAQYMVNVSEAGTEQTRTERVRQEVIRRYKAAEWKGAEFAQHMFYLNK